MAMESSHPLMEAFQGEELEEEEEELEEDMVAGESVLLCWMI